MTYTRVSLRKWGPKNGDFGGQKMTVLGGPEMVQKGGSTSDFDDFRDQNIRQRQGNRGPKHGPTGVQNRPGGSQKNSSGKRGQKKGGSGPRWSAKWGPKNGDFGGSENTKNGVTFQLAARVSGVF